MTASVVVEENQARMSSCCCCPAERVDWSRKGGILCCNTPCGTEGAVANLISWYINEETNQIIVPDKTALLPAWLALIPPIWINLLFFMPICHASAFIFYDLNGSLAMEHRTKYSCWEVTDYQRTSISQVSHELGRTFFGRTKVTLNIYSATGGVDQVRDLQLRSSNDTLVIERLIETINNRINALNGTLPVTTVVLEANNNSNGLSGGLIHQQQPSSGNRYHENIPMATEVTVLRSSNFDQIPGGKMASAPPLQN